MQQMSEMLDVPDGWQVTSLGELGRYFNGRAFKSSEWSKTGRPIIRIQDLTGSNRHPNHYEGEADERSTIRSGDFLISWSATLGAFIWDGPEAVLNQHIFKVESKINKKFHFHLVRNEIAELQRSAHGSGMIHVTKGIFDAIPVAIPESQVMQESIAEVIDTADALQDSASSHLMRARIAVERFKKAILAAACSGRLTVDWQDQHSECTSVLDVLSELRSKKKMRAQREPAIPLDITDLPENYVLSTLGECALLLQYGTSKKCVTDPTEGIPVLRMGNIQDGKLDFGDLKYCSVDDEITRLMLEPGDLLFNRTNSPELVGKSAIYQSDMPASFASYLIRLRFDRRIVLPEFVNYWLNSAWGREWARLAKTDGVSQSNINGSKLALMRIPLPPIDEQFVIVERASKMLTSAEALLVRIRSTSRVVERSSQAVLTKAFHGELIASSE